MNKIKYYIKSFMRWLELDDRQQELTESQCAENSRPLSNVEVIDRKIK